MTSEELLHYEWIVKTLIKRLKINRELDDFYNLGLFFLFEGFHSYDETKGTSLSTYLYQCVRFGFLKELNSQPPPTLSYEEEWEHLRPRFQVTTSFEDDWIAEQDLYTLLRQLDPTVQFIFNQRIQGYSYAEIAKQIGRNEGYIKRTLHRERQKLKAVKKEKDD